MPAFALEGEPPCAAAAAGHGQGANGANGAGLHVPLSCLIRPASSHPSRKQYRTH